MNAIWTAVRLKYIKHSVSIPFSNAEASLVAVDPLIQKLRNRIRKVDAEILKAVRQQASDKWHSDRL